LCNARKPQLEFEGAIYHVLNRGKHRKDLFGEKGAAGSQRGDGTGCPLAPGAQIAPRDRPLAQIGAMEDPYRQGNEAQGHPRRVGYLVRDV